MTMENGAHKNKKGSRLSLQPLLYGVITGIICGVIITLFLVCARVVCSFAFGLYELTRTPLLVVCIIMLVLICCLITAIIQSLCPNSAGSGIPLAEAAARGMLKVKWLRDAAALIAGSLAAFACGMPLGSEGPSIGVGGLIGDGVGSIAKKPQSVRRYLITGGSSAGLAVAFNAPLTGIAFALEETHRRFSPSILLAAFSAVLPAVLVSQLMLWGFSQNAYLHSLGLHEGAAALHFLTQAQYESITEMLKVCAVAAIVGALTALLAAAFNFSIFSLGRLFDKIRVKALKLLPAFLLTAVIGLSLGTAVGTGETTLAKTSIDTAAWLIFTLLLVRTVMTVTASGSGATGGLFLPMIAIGGLFGTLAAKAAVACGVMPDYVPNIIMISISAFFAASARAPISAIALSVELTASFANILPCAIGVAVGTAVSAALRSAPLYERMMENIYAKSHTARVGQNVSLTGVVFEGSLACEKRIRDMPWPYNSLVVGLVRGQTDIVPDGETEILPGDKLTVRAEGVDPDAFAEEMKEYIKSD